MFATLIEAPYEVSVRNWYIFKSTLVSECKRYNVSRTGKNPYKFTEKNYKSRSKHPSRSLCGCWFITFGLMPTVLQCRDEVLQFLLVDELIIEARMPKIKNLNDVIPNLLSNHTDGHDVVGVKLSELIIYRKICNKHSWLVIKVVKIFFQ